MNDIDTSRESFLYISDEGRYIAESVSVRFASRSVIVVTVKYEVLLVALIQMFESRVSCL